ncbi:hypothetical protein CBER1_11097 [Cercospora berteroae]|uniref:Xaa-Pro dipeptidyl-peptidase C-terminal domain-containing protein n=1 Tax=Cercospora berteroae TaxID=357750 RepID=A0A2S6BZV2_9PEZI|nr:hypothetical protein CBER1_11097 [Cercospora berteroae]
MVDQYPLWNDYWEDKKPKLRNITVPMYATASYSTGLHTEGSLRGFQLASSTEKWLRWTTTQEWHDIYQKENIDDLQKFVDKYMKGIDNGWEKTPRIRQSMLGYNRPSVVNRPATEYPPTDFRHETLYLDAATGALTEAQVSEEANSVYQADSSTDEGSFFTHKFHEYTELCGISKVKLFMSTDDHNDMGSQQYCPAAIKHSISYLQDVYVVLRKLDKTGTPLWHQNIPMKDLPPGTQPSDIPNGNVWRYVGPSGRLRASHREVIPEELPNLSTAEYNDLMGPAYVYHPHTSEQKLAKGEIVELEMSLWPGGIVFDAGEAMRLEVKGGQPILPEFEGLERVWRGRLEANIRLRTGPDDTLEFVALKLQQQFIEDSAHDYAGMREIVRGSSTWLKGAEDFGWRMAVQQEEVHNFEFLGKKNRISVFEHDFLPRSRSEIYATPKDVTARPPARNLGSGESDLEDTDAGFG